MIIQKFEDIIAWQKAQDLAVEIFSEFSELKHWGFRDQICKAVVSISNNIAEGFDRSSDADFSRFLYIAMGSASETRSMLYLAVRLKFINSNRQEMLVKQSDEVSRIIRGLVKSLEKKKG
jgi:four helix bundle protein